ncbi:enoyl-CoA hydratase/isomerase family protein [Nocardia sp. NPDC003963]
MSPAPRESETSNPGSTNDRTETSAVTSPGPATEAVARYYSGEFETILLEVDPVDRVATLTLNRPERLNAFNRTMCAEVERAWQIVKLDDSVNAVVLRAAGDRAFSAGLDITVPYGQPAGIWHHEDPGESLSPKWQKMWKPVVCAVHGICTAGAFYFVNEADVVLCSHEATFFDSHVSAGLVSALEPVGLMRRIGLGETLRMALMGNDERVTAQTALRIGLVSEVVAREQLWARAHAVAATIAAKPPTATQGTVKAIWESLDKPYRAALDHGLVYTRLGNPIGRSELAAEAPTATEPRLR